MDLREPLLAGTAQAARLLGTLALVSCIWGCQTETRSDTPENSTAIVTRTQAAQGWEVRDDGHRAGTVILYSDPADARTGYYSVRNPEGQVLGLIDFGGRAWRYHVHQQEPEWLGTGTVIDGVRRILETSALALMAEIELASLQRDH